MKASNKEKFMTDILSYLDNMKKMDISNLYIDGIDKLDLSVISKKVNLPEDAKIYAFFEKETEFKGKEGILVTDYGIYIHDANMIIDGSAKGKLSLSYTEFAEYEAKVEQHLLKYTAILKNKNLSVSKYSEVKLWLMRDPSISEEDEEKLLEKQEGFFLMLINMSKDVKYLFVGEKEGDNTKESELLNSKYIEAFILGENGDEKTDADACRFYKKAFVKYNINGTDQFAFHWSWSGFLFNWLHLLHRRLYIEALISFVVEAVFTGVFFPLTLAYWIASGMINPFLLYKKYSKVVRTFKERNLTEETKIETLKNAGGVNKLTSFIIGLIGLIILVVFVFLFFRGCSGKL